jgi:hypothetical protein
MLSKDAKIAFELCEVMFSDIRPCLFRRMIGKRTDRLMFRLNSVSLGTHSEETSSSVHKSDVFQKRWIEITPCIKSVRAGIVSLFRENWLRTMR